MPLVLDDESVRATGLTERDLAIEVACRLFAAGKLPLPAASRLACLTRAEMESELIRRDLPLVIYTMEMLANDIASVDGVE